MKSTLIRMGYRISTTAAAVRHVALPNQKFYRLAAQRAFKASKRETLFLWKLIDLRIIPGSHDFLNESSLRLLSFQKQWQVSQIVDVLRVLHKFKVNNSVLLKHIENELYLRYEEPLILSINRIRQQKLARKQQLLNKLENASNDIFGILNETGSAASQEPQSLKQQNAQTGEATEGEVKEIVLDGTKIGITPQQMSQICIYLCDLGVTESKLIRLFTEFLREADLLKGSPLNILACLRVTNYLCSLYEQQFLTSPQQYTKRSLKLIQKYQSKDFQQLLPTALENSGQFSLEEFRKLFQYLSEYPVKKRIFKKHILDIFCNNIDRYFGEGAVGIDLVGCFGNVQKILQGDKKLLANYQASSNRYKALIASTQRAKQGTTVGGEPKTEDSTKNPLKYEEGMRIFSQ